MESNRAEEPTIHSFAPVFSAQSRILILGTMASPASLKMGFFYGHPRNAFWRILGDLTADTPGNTPDDRNAFLLRHKIALWDTLKSCIRVGSSDSAIHAEQPTDLTVIIEHCPDLQAIFLNGGAAAHFYRKYQAKNIVLPYFGLPSTSPANARGGYPAKIQAWRQIKPYLTT